MSCGNLTPMQQRAQGLVLLPTSFQPACAIPRCTAACKASVHAQERQLGDTCSVSSQADADTPTPKWP